MEKLRRNQRAPFYNSLHSVFSGSKGAGKERLAGKAEEASSGARKTDALAQSGVLCYGSERAVIFFTQY